MSDRNKSKQSIGNTGSEEFPLNIRESCGNERPPRKVFCQRKKGHKGECGVVIFWKKRGARA